MATVAALKASVVSSLCATALRGQKTTGQPVQAHKWGWHLQWGSLGSQASCHGGPLPNPMQAGAASEQDAPWNRSWECEAGWSSQHSALASQWSMEELWRVCSIPVKSVVVRGSVVQSVVVKVGLALALAYPLLTERMCGDPPAQPAHEQQLFIKLEVSNLNPADCQG